MENILSRRRFFMGMASLGVLGLGGMISACTDASRPSARVLGEGIARFKMGSATITMIIDGVRPRPLDANFVRNVPLETVQKALADASLPIDNVLISYAIMIADIGGRRIMIDTGNGYSGGEATGKLLARMQEANIPPASITDILITHFHGDHINGLRSKTGELNFPNARIFVPRPEWNWWMDEKVRKSAPAAMQGAFAAVDRAFRPAIKSLVFFEPGESPLPSVRSRAAFGHTPGHTAFILDTGAQPILCWGDTTNIAALFVRHPDWAVIFDMDAEKARITRRELSEMAINEKMIVSGYHLPGSAIGVLSRRGDGYQFVPFN